MFRKVKYNTIELKKGTYSKKDILRLKKRFKKIGEVNIICPKCNKKKNIEVPMNLFEEKTGGLLSVIVQKGYCCEHNFTIIIDRNLDVRAREVNDYLIKS